MMMRPYSEILKIVGLIMLTKGLLASMGKEFISCKMIQQKVKENINSRKKFIMIMLKDIRLE